MAKRSIIEIDEDLCNGCGLCIPNCPEGALQIIDGKARMISDLFCDGLGACVGHCPEGAMKVIERDAEPYDEKKTMVNVVKGGPNVIKAHLLHLKDHRQTEFFNQAIEYLEENNIENPLKKDIMENEHRHPGMGGCPGSKVISFDKDEQTSDESGERKSHLRQWPIQLHLVSPMAPYYEKSDVLIAADCTAFSVGDFHKNFLKGKSLAIACPKLDDGQDIYLEKIKSLIDDAQVNTITVVIMQVPCCGGLVYTVQQALDQAKRKVPVKKIVISLQGEILSEDWL